jgi:hypothetical protein
MRRRPKEQSFGRQGVHREIESEGHAENYRAVIDGGCPEDEPVGQRWGKVEPALWRRRHSHSRIFLPSWETRASQARLPEKVGMFVNPT